MCFITALFLISTGISICSTERNFFDQLVKNIKRYEEAYLYSDWSFNEDLTLDVGIDRNINEIPQNVLTNRKVERRRRSSNVVQNVVARLQPDSLSLLQTRRKRSAAVVKIASPQKLNSLSSLQTRRRRSATVVVVASPQKLDSLSSLQTRRRRSAKFNVLVASPQNSLSSLQTRGRRSVKFIVASPQNSLSSLQTRRRRSATVVVVVVVSPINSLQRRRRSAGQCHTLNETNKDNLWIERLNPNRKDKSSTVINTNTEYITDTPTNRSSKNEIQHSVKFDFQRFIQSYHLTPVTYGFGTSNVKIESWPTFLKSLEKRIPREYESFFNEWPRLIQVFSDKSFEYFRTSFVALPLTVSIESMEKSPEFLKLFWPFNLGIEVMNQRLALLGMTGETSEHKLKTNLFAALEKLQGIKIPYNENHVLYSFESDPDLVYSMNRTGLIYIKDKNFIDEGHHLFTEKEAKEITEKVNDAFRLIEEVSPELHTAIHQVIGCIAFYKTQARHNVGGSASSPIGVIWFDPSVEFDRSVPRYAEHIVHEFIHNAVFLAELVHGIYIDHDKLGEAKTLSSIRRVPRDYDKSFHAAYVSTGLIAFHSRAGFLDRAEELAKTLWSSLDELVEMNEKKGLLTESGRAMLQSMVDFMIATRINK